MAVPTGRCPSCGICPGGVSCRCPDVRCPCWRGGRTDAGVSFLQVVLIDYTNYEGKRRWRRIIPEKIWFGSTKWHSTPQWLLHAIDVEKSEARDFALMSVHEWKPE